MPMLTSSKSAPASAELSVWQPVATEPLVIPGQFVVVDPIISTNQYRLVRPPNLPVPPQEEPPAYGPIVAWGFNIFGQSTPPLNGGRTVAVVAGIGHSVALEQDGNVFAWGAGEPGGTNEFDFGQSTVPEALSGVIDVAAGFASSVHLPFPARQPVFPIGLREAKDWDHGPS